MPDFVTVNIKVMCFSLSLQMGGAHFAPRWWEGCDLESKHNIQYSPLDCNGGLIDSTLFTARL